MTDSQKFIAKVCLILAASLGGWLTTLGASFSAGLTPLALGGLLLLLATNVGAILGVTSPSNTRAVDIALTTGVHTRDDVKKIQNATDAGTVVTPEVVAAILAKPEPAPAVPAEPKEKP